MTVTRVQTMRHTDQAEESELAAPLDPLFGPAPAPASARAGLQAQGVNALARWLLDPGVVVSEDMRAALTAEIDISLPGMASSVFAFLVINALCVWLIHTPVFYAGFAANIFCSACRLVAGGICRRPLAPRRKRATELYLVSTLAWCALQGMITGLAMAANNASVQVIGGTSLLAVQGALAARNYSAPRFAGLILAFLTLPFVIGTLCAQNHWLIVIAALTPGYVWAYATTISRFHHTAVASQQVLERARYQARHDPLTGALNRFGLMSALQGGAGLRDAPLGLFYLDLDGFKAVNDSYGHTAGDTLLRMVAERLRRVSRGTDQVARLGGDEFVIVVPGIGPAAAELFAARIIQAVTQDAYIVGPDIAAEVGVSVGFACAPAESQSLTNLLSRADKALYIAKSKGKGVWQRG